MRELFVPHKFRRNSLDRIAQANEIIDEYMEEGLVLTLRQLYYQFVARDIIKNDQTEYDKLGDLLSKARLAGLVDWDAIEDRTRFLRGVPTWDNPEHALNDASRRYQIDMWSNQPYRLEVWVEKDALVGVIDRVCADNDVDYFACRGYVSQSELYTAGKRAESRLMDDDQLTVIIHLGDHDPSGIDMTRDNEERIRMFAGYDVTIVRAALNIDQVRTYNPPPNPVKMTDSRKGPYVEEFGETSWELDALEPRVLRQLILDEINKYRLENEWQARREQYLHDKGLLRKALRAVEEDRDRG